MIEEQRIITHINQEKRIWSSISSNFAKNIQNDTFLNKNQKLVISKVLTCRDGVAMIEGKAGTGKTTILKEIAKGVLESKPNQEILILAPTTKAVEVLQTEGFPNAMTVQKFLVTDDNLDQNINQKTINNKSNNTQNFDNTSTNQKPSFIIVDEASLVSVRQMDKLLKKSTEIEVRVLLVGDTKQHKSVERGNTLQTIIDHSKIEVFSLHQIQRQKESESKQAVELLAKGQTIQGINQFQKLGCIKEIENDQQRLEQVARLYIQNLPKVYANKVEGGINTTDENKNNSHLEKLDNQSWLQKMSQSVGQKIFGQNTKDDNLKNTSNSNEINKTEEQSKTNLPKEKKIELDYFGQAQIDGQEIKKIQYEKLNPQQNTLVITPTHLDGQNIHTAIRQKLKTEELIDQQDHKIETLRSLSWTTIEKARESNYEIGQVLQFTGNKLNFKKGDRYEVVTEESKGEDKNLKLDKNPKEKLNLGYFNELKPKQNETNEKLLIKNLKTKEIKSIPIELNSYFDVFQKESITISKGDLIQCQRQTIIQDKKGIEHKTTNGAIYQIKHISPRTGDITLSNDWILPKDFGNLKSAYYSTSHASQGQTVNHSIFYTSNHSQHLLNQDMIYVANSRFRLTNTILTPNLEQFKQYAQKPDPKSIALSVIQDKQNSIGNKVEDKNKVENKIEDKLNKEIKAEPYISFSARQEPLPIDTNKPRMRMRR